MRPDPFLLLTPFYSSFEIQRETFHTLILRNVNERLEAEQRIHSLDLAHLKITAPSGPPHGRSHTSGHYFIKLFINRKQRPLALGRSQPARIWNPSTAAHDAEDGGHRPGNSGNQPLMS